MLHNLRFSPFGWGELQAEAQVSGASDRDLARAAIDELLQRVAAGDHRRATVVPDLPLEHSVCAELEIELGADAEAVLEREARRQGVELVRLLEYAVLAHLANDPPG